MGAVLQWRVWGGSARNPTLSLEPEVVEAVGVLTDWQSPSQQWCFHQGQRDCLAPATTLEEEEEEEREVRSTTWPLLAVLPVRCCDGRKVRINYIYFFFVKYESGRHGLGTLIDAHRRSWAAMLVSFWPSGRAVAVQARLGDGEGAESVAVKDGVSLHASNCGWEKVILQDFEDLISETTESTLCFLQVGRFRNIQA